MSRETELSKTIRDHLQLMQNAGIVLRHDRLQSGKVLVKKGRFEHWMHLCKEGTPDRYAILKDGSILWIEVKRPGGTTTGEQIYFREMVKGLPGHNHIVATYLSQVEKFFNEYTDKIIGLGMK